MSQQQPMLFPHNLGEKKENDVEPRKMMGEKKENDVDLTKVVEAGFQSLIAYQDSQNHPRKPGETGPKPGEAVELVPNATAPCKPVVVLTPPVSTNFPHVPSVHEGRDLVLHSFYTSYYTWKRMRDRHSNCCADPKQVYGGNVRPNWAAVEVLDFARRQHGPRSEGIRERQNAVRVQSTRTIAGSQLWKQAPLFLSEQKSNNTLLYVNWTNPLMPGYGWLGQTQPAGAKIDDEDELNLFWKTDVSQSVRPDHPLLHPTMENSTVRAAYPLSPTRCLLSPSVIMYDEKSGPAADSTVCNSRQLAVLHVPLCVEWTESEAMQKAKITACLESVRACIIERGYLNVILPLGKFYRSGFSPLIVAHAVSKIILPLCMKNSLIEMLEIVLSDRSRKPPTAVAAAAGAGAGPPLARRSVSDQWHHFLLTTLRSYAAQ